MIATCPDCLRVQFYEMDDDSWICESCGHVVFAGTPAALFAKYDGMARTMRQPFRWWYLRKAQSAKRQWDARRTSELARVLREESNQESRPE